jgi:DNA repair protein RadD
MSTPALRDYQVQVLAQIEKEVAAGKRRPLLVAPTGAGKTVIAGACIAKEAARGGRVLFLAHRRELIQQASMKLYAVGIGHGIIQAGFPTRLGESVQLASIPTLHARAVRSTAMDMPPADLVVVDEAHHVRARSYRQILDAYPEAMILGMTATPCRGDGRGLGNAFNTLIECPSVAELQAAGYLVATRVYAPTRPNLKGVKVERGDYVEKQLAERMDRAELVGDVVENWFKLAERRRTVVFATGVAHSVHLRDEFRRSGVWAEHLDGTTPAEERDRILAGLAAGTVEAVCNAMVLTEGWDAPSVSCLVLARPTRHMGLYRQMVGRVLRPAPGKTDAIILDHAGAVFEHGFPDGPIAWTLHADQRAENRVHASRGTPHSPGLATCPECAAVRTEGRPCPQCGWRPRPKPVAVDVADGELGQVDRKLRVASQIYGDAKKRHFNAQLLFIARERGYKPGWAAYKFKEKFGHWPPRGSPAPMPPDEATRAWVRSRRIAYAKAISRSA